MSPRAMPTILPSRDERDSWAGLGFWLLAGLESNFGIDPVSSFVPVLASSEAKPPPPVLPHLSQNRGKFSGPRTASMASNPSGERRSL